MFDLQELEKLVEDGEVTKRKHPTKDLFIYTYLKTWYPEWSDTLRWARGLVLDSTGKVIACPFKKFFNYSEIRSEVDELISFGVGYRIQEKLDGSLGILFHDGDDWILSTKGSFNSKQAEKGKQILDEKYPQYQELDKKYTYLFEIIYPENQIVVNYSNEEMILLAIVDTISGKEISTKDTYIPESFQIVKQYDLTVDYIIKDMSRPDYCSLEGFVVVFENGTRVKLNYDEYVKLHKIVSDFKPKNVIELMMSGGNVDALITSLPDEFREDLIKVKVETELTWNGIASIAILAFFSIATEDKKTFALEAIKKYPEYKHFLFELYKDYYIRGIKDLTNQHFSQNVNLNEMTYNRILEILEK